MIRFLAFLVISSLCMADLSVLTGEYEGIYGDELTVPQARDKYKIEAVRRGLESFAMMISSETVVKNYALETDQIVARVEGMAMNVQMDSEKEILDRNKCYLKVFVNFEIDKEAVLNRLEEISKELKRGGDSVERIKYSGEFFFGESMTEDRIEANREAIEGLVNQISAFYRNSYYDIHTGDESDLMDFAKTNINTFRADFENVFKTKTENGSLIRYVERKYLPELFETRKKQISFMLEEGSEFESKHEIGSALRNYFWSYCLVRSLPDRDRFEFKGIKNKDTEFEGKLIDSYLHNKMRSLLRDIEFEIIADKERDSRRDIFLTALYKGVEIRDLYYTYFDGRSNSIIQPLRNGRALCEFSGDYAKNLNEIRIDIIYRYEDEARRNRSIQYVVEELSSGAWIGETSRKRIRMGADPVIQTVQQVQKAQPVMQKLSEIPEAPVLQISNFRLYDEVEEVSVPEFEKRDDKQYDELDLSDEQKLKSYEFVNEIVKAVNTKDYSEIDSLFTTDGKHIFDKLIAYGDACIMTDELELKAYSLNGEIAVRSIPMRFVYPKNNKATIEDVIFVFNKDLKIDNITFGLTQTAIEDIMAKPETFASASERLQLIHFMENYQTAYNLQRLDYIESIFAQNALIIVGKILENDPTTSGEKYKPDDPKKVKYTRFTKQEYIDQLKRVFASNEFINLKLEDNQFNRASDPEEKIYGIQIKQSYYSNNYADEGYLFLMMDLKDPKKPRIYVRSWQPEKEADGSIIGLSDFSF